MYVICFYWQGERWSSSKNDVDDLRYKRNLSKVGLVTDGLPERYINNLYRGVTIHATRPFKFICFTNEHMEGLDDNIETRPFPMVTNKGVLPRIYMFSKEAGLGDRQVLCLDLDVVIVGSLDKIMAYNGLFCTRAKFKPGEQHKIDGDIMSFRAGEEIDRIMWQPFIKDPVDAEDWTKGRERYWVRRCLNNQADLWNNIAPNNVISYKWHVKRKTKMPRQAAIVSCHGFPRPHQIKDKEIKKHWNAKGD